VVPEAAKIGWNPQHPGRECVDTVEKGYVATLEKDHHQVTSSLLRLLESYSGNIKTRRFKIWMVNVRKIYLQYLVARLSRAGNQDMEIGRDFVRCICDSSWWNWDGGSIPLFWRWPYEFRTQMRDGTPLWFDPTIAPGYKIPQRAENNPVLRARAKEKLDKVLQRRYFEVGLVKSLTTFFGVPKGEDDR
jgi:hypothetical protein